MTSYTYAADGRKLRSLLGTVVTDYADGTEWQGTALSVIHMEEGHL